MYASSIFIYVTVMKLIVILFSVGGGCIFGRQGFPYFVSVSSFRLVTARWAVGCMVQTCHQSLYCIGEVLEASLVRGRQLTLCRTVCYGDTFSSR